MSVFDLLKFHFSEIYKCLDNKICLELFEKPSSGYHPPLIKETVAYLVNDDCYSEYECETIGDNFPYDATEIASEDVIQVTNFENENDFEMVDLAEEGEEDNWEDPLGIESVLYESTKNLDRLSSAIQSALTSAVTTPVSDGQKTLPKSKSKSMGSFQEFKKHVSEESFEKISKKELNPEEDVSNKVELTLKQIKANKTLIENMQKLDEVDLSKNEIVPHLPEKETHEINVTDTKMQSKLDDNESILKPLTVNKQEKKIEDEPDFNKIKDKKIDNLQISTFCNYVFNTESDRVLSEVYKKPIRRRKSKNVCLKVKKPERKIKKAFGGTDIKIEIDEDKPEPLEDKTETEKPIKVRKVKFSPREDSSKPNSRPRSPKIFSDESMPIFTSLDKELPKIKFNSSKIDPPKFDNIPKLKLIEDVCNEHISDVEDPISTKVTSLKDWCQALKKERSDLHAEQVFSDTLDEVIRNIITLSEENATQMLGQLISDSSIQTPSIENESLPVEPKKIFPAVVNKMSIKGDLEEVKTLPTLEEESQGSEAETHDTRVNAGIDAQYDLCPKSDRIKNRRVKWQLDTGNFNYKYLSATSDGDTASEICIDKVCNKPKQLLVSLPEVYCENLSGRATPKSARSKSCSPREKVASSPREKGRRAKNGKSPSDSFYQQQMYPYLDGVLEKALAKINKLRH